MSKKDDSKESTPRAVAAGTLFDGLVDCYVLEDGRRVVSQRGILRALQNAEDEFEAGSTYIGRYLAKLPSEYKGLASSPTIKFQPPRGAPAIGRPAEWVVDFFQAYVDAHFEGKLHPSQEPLARNAARILRTLGKVGLSALIDEATGYELVREQGALAKLFDRLLRPAPAPWERMFQHSLIVALCKLDRVDWEGGRHPRHLASTQKRIYDMLVSPEVGAELRRRNPQPHHGSNHHQILTDDAKENFRQQLAIVEVIANQSHSKADFWARMERQYGSGLLQLSIPGT